MEEKITILEKENLEYKKNYLLLLKSKKDVYDSKYKIIKIICIILYITTFWLIVSIPMIFAIQLYFKNSFKIKIKKNGFKNLDEFNYTIDKIIKNEEIDTSILAKLPDKPEYSKQMKSIIEEKQKHDELNEIMEKEKEQKKIKEQQIKELKEKNLLKEKELKEQKEKEIRQPKENTIVKDINSSNDNSAKIADTIQTISYIIGFIICVVVLVAIWSGDLFSSGNSTGSSGGDKKHEKYLKTAVEQLISDNIAKSPVEELSISGNKIIYYIMVMIS